MMNSDEIFAEIQPAGIVRDVDDGRHGLLDLVVDDGVDGDSDAVLRQDFLRRDVERHGPQVADGDLETRSASFRPSRWKRSNFFEQLSSHILRF